MTQDKRRRECLIAVALGWQPVKSQVDGDELDARLWIKPDAESVFRDDEDGVPVLPEEYLKILEETIHQRQGMKAPSDNKVAQARSRTQTEALSRPLGEL